jgi:hypothetical protein
MKLKAAEPSEALGAPPSRRHAVTLGGRYGHLEVLEELPHKPDSGERRFRCLCHNVMGGQSCGALVVKRTTQLMKLGAFKGCESCTREYLKQTRQIWNKGGWY